MAQTVIVQLTDDIDGGDADVTISFALNGKSYEIDLSTKNAEKLREAFAPYVDKARRAGRGESGPKARPSDKGSGGGKTMFSGLDQQDKERFRTWAELPTARRISDAKVQEWIDAGRP